MYILSYSHFSICFFSLSPFSRLSLQLSNITMNAPKFRFFLLYIRYFNTAITCSKSSFNEVSCLLSFEMFVFLSNSSLFFKYIGSIFIFSAPLFLVFYTLGENLRVKRHSMSSVIFEVKSAMFNTVSPIKAMRGRLPVNLEQSFNSTYLPM